MVSRMSKTSMPVTPVLALAACAALVAGCGSVSSAKTPASKPAAASSASITAKDFAFSAKHIDAKAGKFSVSLKNSGQAPHEFVVLKTSTAPAKLKVSGGKVSEADSVGEIGEVDSGKTGKHTFDLKPGHYVFVCNVPGHYMDGMRGSLTVR
jgi:uncharacterized cupredoxin-like copper-binding protein